MNNNTKEELKRGRKPSQLELSKIYQKFKRYRKYLYVAISKTPNWVRESAGERCIIATENCVQALSVALRTYDFNVKIIQIDRFLTAWDVSFDNISFFSEVKAISKKQRGVLLDYREAIEGQVQALRTWCCNQLNKQ